MKLVSFFSGAGGLDLGFKKAGFEVVQIFLQMKYQSVMELLEGHHVKVGVRQERKGGLMIQEVSYFLIS